MKWFLIGVQTGILANTDTSILSGTSSIYQYWLVLEQLYLTTILKSIIEHKWVFYWPFI